MRILIFCGDKFHAPSLVREGISALGQLPYSVDWVEDSSTWRWERLSDYTAIVLSKANVTSHENHRPWLDEKTGSLLEEFVHRGGGLLAIHAGTASYRDLGPVRRLLGGVFDHHPPPCSIELLPVAPHPLTAGANDPFPVHDEHYHMIVDDPQLDVFLRSRSALGTQPAGWTRLAGLGRVCVVTPGHFPEVWLHPGYQQILRNALTWVTAPR